MLKNTSKRHVDLLLIAKEGKSHYALIKDFNTFMYDYTLHLRENIFAYLFSVHNTISSSRHEQVFLIMLRSERYFFHHRAQ